ncbi:MAG: lipid A-modifier LpxR family protein [Gemmatimonadaceae bacterium]
MIRTATRLALVTAVLAPFGAATAFAQSPRGISLRLDNDAFDFWMQPYNRPDEEYTSGVHITYDGARAPWWSRSFFSGAPACTFHVQDCRSARAELGQDIYTPSASVDDPRPVAGSRANGGWLYFAQSAQSLHESRSDEFTVSLGVTGPPSLAQFTQTLAHSVAPAFNRPTDWSRQIRFEPGAIVSYEQQRRTLAYSAGQFGVDVLPSVSVKAGNVETGAAAGVESRAGWNLPHPWLPESVPASIALVGGVSTRAVLRDIFLDGNTFHPSYRVGHDFLVGSGDIGVELRYRAFSLSYRAVSESRAYAGGPAWHPWASIVSGVTFDR